MRRPIALTMGDPAGVGPELIEELFLQFPDDGFLVFGDARLWAGVSDIEIIADADAFRANKINIVDTPCAHLPVAGKPDHANAAAIIAAIEGAVGAVKKGVASALLTAPINKALLYEGAGFAYPGHTEFLAALDGRNHVVMMLAAKGVLRVVPATIHIPLRRVEAELTPDLLRNVVKILHHDLAKYLQKSPKISLSGLNPHAGENGHMGRAEIEWIAPLIDELRGEGFDVYGPYPADTMFTAPMRETYDVAVAMYHDQALIPIKTLAFDAAVNVTLGLSFLRTSPDHGTAYDIAGKAVANPRSMIEAYQLAKLWS